MTTTLNRRGFLGAGVLLAAGGLTLPRTALAAPSGLVAPPAGTAALVAQIRAVLDRPSPGWYGESVRTEYGCTCARCRALRRQEWECLSCGYYGSWLVSGCECREARRSNIEYCQREIRAIEQGHQPDAGCYSLERLRAMLAESQGWPDVMCRAHPDGDYRQRVELRGHNRCAHGAMFCPCCGNDGDGCTMDTPDDLLTMIRDLRAVLRAAVATGGTA
jgi:hypothetical protein